MLLQPDDPVWYHDIVSAVEQQRQAIMDLAEYAKWGPRRDELIVAARAAGISVPMIAECTRLSCGHVHAIIKKYREP
jgi:hypothetical protein